MNLKLTINTCPRTNSLVLFLHKFAPAGWWLMAQILALWPTWLWMSRRMSDGSDDPLGLLALATLGIIIFQMRQQLCEQPNPFWLYTSLLLSVIATFASGHMPALVCGVLSMLAIAATLLAFLPQTLARLPILGLCILALPLLSSLQFYAGYPLRVITAEVSTWLLGLFHDVTRSGSTLLINGHLVIVDAPCSGVQMAWLGYFTACTLGVLYRLHNKQFFMQLPFVGLLVLAGNILRNSILVALQASEQQVIPEWLHQGIGFLTLGAVCFCIYLVMTIRLNPKQPANTIKNTSLQIKATVFGSTGWLRTGLMIFGVCVLGSAYQATAITALQNNMGTPYMDWSYTWKGTPIRPLALSEIELRFAQNFPGSITRMTDEKRTFVFRQINEATRKLHPAVDCYRGLGYSIEREQLYSDAQGLLWRCFVATQANTMLQVCEHIEDRHAQAYTDTSAWYWSALTQPNNGPWTTITIAQSINSVHTTPATMLE